MLNVQSGVYYQFVYRARNVHGDGPSSDPVTILAATVPIQMAEPTINLDTLNVQYVISF